MAFRHCRIFSCVLAHLLLPCSVGISRHRTVLVLYYARLRGRNLRNLVIVGDSDEAYALADHMKRSLVSVIESWESSCEGDLKNVNTQP